MLQHKNRLSDERIWGNRKCCVIRTHNTCLFAVLLPPMMSFVCVLWFGFGFGFGFVNLRGGGIGTKPKANSEKAGPRRGCRIHR